MKKYELKCYKGDEKRILVTEKFVKKNKFEYARTEKEILERIKNDSGFGFTEVLSDYLGWENAKGMYVDEYVKKVNNGEEKAPKKITDIYETAQDFLDYMVFGWMKSLDERGISASRTVSKLGHWLWLMGREDLEKIIHDDELYNPYGAPALIAVCDKVGIDTPNNLKEFSTNK